MKAMILSHPALYQAYQAAGGFFGARIKAIADYLTHAAGHAGDRYRMRTRPYPAVSA